MWMSKPIGQGFLHGSQGSCKHLANLLLFYKNRRSHHHEPARDGDHKKMRHNINNHNLRLYFFQFSFNFL